MRRGSEKVQKMKKSIIAAAALALLASTGAKAADIVTYQEQPVAAPAAPAQVNWNGVYVGGTIGGSWADADTKIKAGKSKLAKKDVSPNSFIGGLYAGYNFQPTFLSNSFLKDIVFGVETDFLFNSGDATGTKAYKDGGDDYLYRASVKQKWNGATRIRAGYALGSEGRFLPYIAGGVSYADIQARARIADGKDKKTADWDRYSKTKSVAGWNIGAGIDYVPPILNDHIVLRAEYRFTDFGSQTFSKDIDAGGVAKQKVDFNQNDFRVGVAYKF